MICVADVAHHIYIKWIFIRTPGVISIDFFHVPQRPSIVFYGTFRETVGGVMSSVMGAIKPLQQEGGARIKKSVMYKCDAVVPLMSVSCTNTGESTVSSSLHTDLMFPSASIFSMCHIRHDYSLRMFSLLLKR